MAKEKKATKKKYNSPGVYMRDGDEPTIALEGEDVKKMQAAEDAKIAAE